MADSQDAELRDEGEKEGEPAQRFSAAGSELAARAIVRMLDQMVEEHEAALTAAGCEVTWDERDTMTVGGKRYVRRGAAATLRCAKKDDSSADVHESPEV